MQCTTPRLLDAVHEEWVYSQAGFKVLECVDMLVFKKIGSNVQFLMLKREDRVLSKVGWEYPKGPALFHETLREAAARELKEETGCDISSYIFRGELGYQTVNVAWRKKPYDTLHVLGLTYLFTGREDQIVPYKKEGLRSSEWMTWEDARQKVWMQDYGPPFFDRWKEREAEILLGT
jgi:8-oxo-dGTP pyrophosphatase MutT (NUDIX family)